MAYRFDVDVEQLAVHDCGCRFTLSEKHRIVCDVHKHHLMIHVDLPPNAWNHLAVTRGGGD